MFIVTRIAEGTATREFVAVFESFSQAHSYVCTQRHESGVRKLNARTRDNQIYFDDKLTGLQENGGSINYGEYTIIEEEPMEAAINYVDRFNRMVQSLSNDARESAIKKVMYDLEQLNNDLIEVGVTEINRQVIFETVVRSGTKG